MYTVARAVEEIVSHSDFAIEGLQTRCLNLSTYAKAIQPEVALLAKKPVQNGSIVVALARLGKKYQSDTTNTEAFKFYNLVSRTGLTELTFAKTKKSQSQVAELYNAKPIQNAQFFVSTIGISEIAIITHEALSGAILQFMHGTQPLMQLPQLASLTMQVDMETVDTPRQSYTVIKQLALRDITLVEYITSPSELTIILYERDLKESFSILYDKFFSQSGRS